MNSQYVEFNVGNYSIIYLLLSFSKKKKNTYPENVDEKKLNFERAVVTLIECIFIE